MRRAGVLLNLSSLPGPGPIGCIGDARRFVDFLAAAGQRVWQVLPLTPPALSGSPYSAYSVFAGNPYYIDLAALEEQGLLPLGSGASLSVRWQDRVDFDACEQQIMPLLRMAFRRGFRELEEEIAAFREEHAFWLEDYALYMAIRTKQGDISYHDWPVLLRMREPGEMAATRRLMEEQINFWIFTQYLFFTQWRELRCYANGRGIALLGDMPIYTAAGSADVWSCKDAFLVDRDNRPSFVAGVPPDAFSAEGQLWGNPLYDWDYLMYSGYEWWLQRLRTACVLYDEIRIDHFRGLDEYYAIPAGATDAREGTWLKGPGMAFFRAVRQALPHCKLIAEDLGVRTEGVDRLLEDSGLPGMYVLQFAFQGGDSAYLPHNHRPHGVAYIGTHDNDTAVGWLQHAEPEEAEAVRQYFHLSEEEGLHWGLIRGLYGSVADTAVVQMQDFLGLGSEARMNTPATVTGNWTWRLEKGVGLEELADQIAQTARRYGR